MVNVIELKTILKENKIHFYSYWNKKRLLDFVIEHDLLPEKTSEKEKNKDSTYDRLKTIKQIPRKVRLEDIETSEIKTFPSINKAAKSIDRAPLTISYWDGRVWKNKYKVVIQ